MLPLSANSKILTAPPVDNLVKDYNSDELSLLTPAMGSFYTGYEYPLSRSISSTGFGRSIQSLFLPPDLRYLAQMTSVRLDLNPETQVNGSWPIPG